MGIPAGVGAGEAGQATALVVDAEVTSYLMMGALSPGLKRHSVTLFEGIHHLFRCNQPPPDPPQNPDPALRLCPLMSAAC